MENRIPGAYGVGQAGSDPSEYRESVEGGKGSGNGKPAELFVVRDDPLCNDAIELVKKKNVEVTITEVSPVDYLTPRRDVPKLLTLTGRYTDLRVIERIIDHELLGEKESRASP